jgi:ferredoxin
VRDKYADIPDSTSWRVAMNRLVVDPIACNGHGICAELFPERIRLDDWGYPIIDPAAVPHDLEGHARRAVQACPALALRWQPVDDAPAAPVNVGPAGGSPRARRSTSQRT